MTRRSHAARAAHVQRQRLEEEQLSDSLSLWPDSDRQALRDAYRELRGNKAGNKRAC